MPDDPLAVIAQAIVEMRATQAHQDATQRLALRLQAYALTLIGLTVLLLDFLGWQHLVIRQETSQVQAALLRNTQDIAAQTKALLERLAHP